VALLVTAVVEERLQGLYSGNTQDRSHQLGESPATLRVNANAADGQLSVQARDATAGSIPPG